jgi:hypothetical protein
MINWKVRYAALFERYPELADPDRTILEVGSGTEGIARHLGRSVVGVDRTFAGPVNPFLAAVRGSARHLPFSDGAFDDVLCVDTLEHLAGGERRRAILELIRVARKRVIISGPAGAFAEWGDAAYADHIRQRRRPVPGWLEEHLQQGMPSLGDLLDIMIACGHPFTVHVNEGVMQHYSGLFADNFPFMTRFLEWHDKKFPLEAPLGRANGDVPYSYLFTIDTTSTRRVAATEPEPARVGARLVPAGPQRRPAQIFAVGHRVDRMPAIPGIRRILAGAAGKAPGLDPEILRDDGGDSIADRNRDFSEMTAIYWVWKNLADLDGVGFCHYRRYFDFRESARQATRTTHLCTSEEVRTHQSSFSDRLGMAQVLHDGAIIVTRTTEEGVANAEQYMTAHVPEHYLAMVNCILTRHPYLARQVVAHVRDSGFYGNNMFVMRWTDFDRLCQFWFDCLFILDREMGSKPGGYQRRVLAFLSERLFDIYVRWLRDSGRRVVEYPLFFLQDSAFSIST